MLSHVRITVRSTLAAGLAGLAVLAAGPASASPASAASAGPARTSPAPAATGAFSTWTAARRAAGYAPYVPTRTAGLTRTNKILVSRCAARPGNDIFAEWGSTTTFLSLDQNNTGGPCSSIGPARFLRSYQAGRQSYALYGFCGRGAQPPCGSSRAVLALVWKTGSRYYRAYSRNQPAGTLVTFAASIRRY